MKTHQTLFFILLFTVFNSCNNNDDVATNDTLSGEWNLTNISGGLAGIDLSFENGMVIWDFNETTSIVTIQNNTTEDFTIFESGTYGYTIQNAGDYDTITINTINLGAIEILQNSINIDQRVTDGVLITLNR